MNTKTLFAVAALAFSTGAAIADDATVVKDTFVAERTRAEVRAEVVQARAEGVLRFATEGNAHVTAQAPMAKSMLTREEVRAQIGTQKRARNASFYETTGE